MIVSNIDPLKQECSSAIEIISFKPLSDLGLAIFFTTIPTIDLLPKGTITLLPFVITSFDL